MRHAIGTSRVSLIVFQVATLAVALTAGCGDDGGAGQPDSSVSIDASSSDGAATSDAAAPSSDGPAASDAGDASSVASDAASDGPATIDASASTDATSGGDLAGAMTTLDDGTYNATVWTCGGASGPRDLKAFATSIGIAEVHFVVMGGAGRTEAVNSATCTRTTQFTLTYPSAGTITTTSAAAFTCSPTCVAAQCTPGPQPVITDTFAVTKTATGFSATRTLGTPIGIQLAGGCQAGGTEAVTWTKL